MLALRDAGMMTAVVEPETLSLIVRNVWHQPVWLPIAVDAIALIPPGATFEIDPESLAWCAMRCLRVFVAEGMLAVQGEFFPALIWGPELRT
jgi:hypothetical protein